MAPGMSVPNGAARSPRPEGLLAAGRGVAISAGSAASTNDPQVRLLPDRVSPPEIGKPFSSHFPAGFQPPESEPFQALLRVSQDSRFSRFPPRSDPLGEWPEPFGYQDGGFIECANRPTDRIDRRQLGADVDRAASRR
jgi:hypothetical protein